jgi:uncharacterized surface protein with fasciclin (FAS1) repeats
MKIISKFKFLALTVVTALYVTSCSNETTQDEVSTTPENVNSDLIDLASKEDDLKLFTQALRLTNFNFDQKNGEVAERGGKRGFTVLSPTDEAFKAFLNENGYASVSDVPLPILYQITFRNVLIGKFRAKDFKTGYFNTLWGAGVNGSLSMYVDKSANGVKFNGVANVVKANLENNSVSILHKVDKVIPAGTIVIHALANPNFKSLVGALTSPGQPDFVKILSGDGPFTVFAPTNAAFASLDAELAPGGIASVSAENLTKVLQYHVLSGNVLAKSLKNNLEVTTLLTQKFTVNLPPPTIKDANGRVSKIIATDVRCSNGVIHVLDKVLLPTL